MIGPGDERARPATGPAFADAVTFAFGDPRAGAYGLARLGLSGEGAGSALAVAFDGREPVAALARGGVALDGDADFAALDVAGLRATVEEPLRRWRLSWDEGFELEFEALGPPATLAADEPAALAGGMEGYEQLCRVRGTARGARVECLGQRGHAWGEPDWDRIALTRSVGAWLEDDTGFALTGVRAAPAADHAAEATWAALLDADGPRRVEDARLSTTYDGDGRQRRAGLELSLGGEDQFLARAAGEVVCGSTLELGQLRLDCAFLRWHMHGRTGVGRYDVVRHA